jgi:hypothetical protein
MRSHPNASSAKSFFAECAGAGAIQKICPMSGGLHERPGFCHRLAREASLLSELGVFRSDVDYNRIADVEGGLLSHAEPML